MSSKKDFVEKLEKDMNKLTTLLKSKVTVIYFHSGKTETEEGKLEYVETKKFIRISKKLEQSSIPFLGDSMAIQEITDENGKILYRNRLVDESYNSTTSTKVRKESGFE